MSGSSHHPAPGRTRRLFGKSQFPEFSIWFEILSQCNIRRRRYIIYPKVRLPLIKLPSDQQQMPTVSPIFSTFKVRYIVYIEYWLISNLFAFIWFCSSSSDKREQCDLGQGCQYLTLGRILPSSPLPRPAICLTLCLIVKIVKNGQDCQKKFKTVKNSQKKLSRIVEIVKNVNNCHACKKDYISF